MQTDSQQPTGGASLPPASGYAVIQAQLIDLIGKAGEATNSATNEQELQTCGQLTRRLCHALTGL